MIDTRSKPTQLKKRLRKIHESDSENEEAKHDDPEDGKTVEQLQAEIEELERQA